MKNDAKLSFNSLKYYLILIFFIFLPIFFLPVVRDITVIPKFYFLLSTAVLLLVLSIISLIINRKIFWSAHPFIQPLGLVIFSLLISLVLMTPNKIMGLYNPHYGLLLFFSYLIILVIGYDLLGNQARKHGFLPEIMIGLPALINSLFYLGGYGLRLLKIQLPVNSQFLINSNFNVFGTSLELAIFQLFAVLLMAIILWQERTKKSDTVVRSRLNTIYFLIFAVIVVATILHFSQIARSLIGGNDRLILPPFNISWSAAVEILKNPLTGIFGVGIDNFSSLFTKVKDVNYNLSPLWQINDFATSRSAILHVLAETGILGLVAFGILFYQIIKSLKDVGLVARTATIFSLVVIVLFPPSFVLWYLFFLSLFLVSKDLYARRTIEVYEIQLTNLMPVLLGLVIVLSLVVGTLVWYSGRIFASEILFKRSLDSARDNNLRGLYENQQKAISLNPFNEDYHIAFSRTNMILAINLASKKPQEITDSDRQIIAQAIQAAIAEAKTVLSLNPNKASYWHFLGNIYRDIINVARGAETWTVTAYQQAILLDPQNPIYRLNLGGVYYLFQNYELALRLFEQTASLKPNWSNAYYNLAWTYYQLKDYQKAVLAMQQVLSLVNPKTEEADFNKAQNDLEEFKKQLPTPVAESAPTPTGILKQLALPTPPTATVEPRIELPVQASPSAR